jgi:GMP synthase PP-ATPase subunit
MVMSARCHLNGRHDRGPIPIPRRSSSRVAISIINEVCGINRVAHDVTSKPLSTIEWE